MLVGRAGSLLEMDATGDGVLACVFPGCGSWHDAAGDASPASRQEAEAHVLLSALLAEQVGRRFQLPRPVLLQGGATRLTHATVTSRGPASARALFLRGDDPADARGEEGAEEEHEVRWRGAAHQVAATGLLRWLNRVWAAAGLQAVGAPVQAVALEAEAVSAGLVLTRLLPNSVTLAGLKRRCSGRDAAERAADFLGGDPAKLARLAASTAAFLASNYLLGASTGDGDNILLTSEGILYRVDFGCLFGGQARGIGGASSLLFDAAAVWLPRAITTALGRRWPEVQHAALVAFRVGAAALRLPRQAGGGDAPGAWLQAQAALLQAEHRLSVSIDRHIAGLQERSFDMALRVADCNLSKQLNTFLHDTFGSGGGHVLGDLPRLGRQPSQAPADFPGGWCDVDAGDLAKLACSLEVAGWRTAMCALACLSGQRQAAAQMVRRLLRACLLAAAASEDATAQSRAMQLLSAAVRHEGPEVQQWLARALGSEDHRRCLAAVAGLAADGVACAGHGDPPTDGALDEGLALALCGVCALARLGLAAEPCPRDGRAWLEEVAPMAAHEGQVVREGAVQLVVALLRVDDPSLSCMLPALAQHISVEELVRAARGVGPDDRFALVRALEGVAKGAGGSEEACSWARLCLASLAQDEDAEVSRAAICAIACAVHDEDEGVRHWARGFLTGAARSPGSESLRSPVYALVRMAQDLGTPRPGPDIGGAPPGHNPDLGVDWELREALEDSGRPRPQPGHEAGPPR